MPDPDNRPFRFFDPNVEVGVIERRLPHWSQSDTISFVTWRTWDSIPKDVLTAWLEERKHWLGERKIDPERVVWKLQLLRLPAAERREYYERFSTRWQNMLDSCHGECVLRQPSIAKIVSDSLLSFDGRRYKVTDFVVMPNHVHLLVSFSPGFDMLRQCANWKHFTARAINAHLGRSGRFWQTDGYDHLVRSPEQFLTLRTYIADNPVRARLRGASSFIFHDWIRRLLNPSVGTG
jgi:REP element-mobilizing transposase RayT